MNPDQTPITRADLYAVLEAGRAAAYGAPHPIDQAHPFRAMTKALRRRIDAANRETPMTKSPAHQEGYRYRIQAVDANHGMPVHAIGADNQTDAFTAGDAMRHDEAHAGRTIEIVRQSKSFQGDPIRWRWHNEACQWAPVGWNTDDARPRRTRPAGPSNTPAPLSPETAIMSRGMKRYRPPGQALTLGQWFKKQRTRNDEIGELARIVCSHPELRGKHMKPSSVIWAFMDFNKGLDAEGQRVMRDLVDRALDEWEGKMCAHKMSVSPSGKYAECQKCRQWFKNRDGMWEVVGAAKVPAEQR